MDDVPLDVVVVDEVVDEVVDVDDDPPLLAAVLAGVLFAVVPPQASSRMAPPTSAVYSMNCRLLNRDVIGETSIAATPIYS